MEKKFDELVVELLLRMYEPATEGSDLAQFTRYGKTRLSDFSHCLPVNGYC